MTTVSKKTRGQGLVEFALILPILLLLTAGLLEGGRLLLMYSSVVTATREAVRYGVATGDNGAGISKAQDCAGIREAAKRVAQLVQLEDSDISIQYDSGPGTAAKAACSGAVSSFAPQSGDRIVVTVSTTYTPTLPFIPLSSFTISSTAARTYVGAISITGGSTAAAPGGGATATSPAATSTAPAETPTATPAFTCEVTHSGSIANGPAATWYITNNSGTSLHINNIKVTWSSQGQRKLTNVTLGSTPIFTGQDSDGSFSASGNWQIPTNVSALYISFSKSTSDIRIQVQFTEPGCPTLDSDN